MKSKKNTINHRVVRIFVLLGFLLFGSGIFLIPLADADPIWAEIQIKDNGTFSPSEREGIRDGLVRWIKEINNTKKGWACVVLPRSDFATFLREGALPNPDDLAYVPPIRRAPRIYFTFEFLTPFIVKTDLKIELSPTRSWQWTGTAIKISDLQSKLAELNTPTLCSPKAKTTVKRTRVGTIVNDHWETEAQLTLDEDGKIITAIPTSYRYNVSYASCPQSGAGQGEITLMGAYDATDNKLVMDLALGDGSPLSVGYYFSCRGQPMWVHGGVIGEVSIALEDGAHSISSGGVGGETWEISLDLSYDAEDSDGFPSS